MKTIRIGGATGFWGDSTMCVPQLLRGGSIDYLVFDYLAEITMSIMARARAKNPEAGYATDFVPMLSSYLEEIAERKVKVISNAGGVNPVVCGRLLQQAANAKGLKLKVAVVTGDDLLPRQDEFRARGLREMFSGAPMPDKLWSLNAYLGGGAIAAALAQGADIVITGRCVDSAVTLGACIHEFGWRPDDYDRLAAGSLAGHILECGAQASGGLHTDWHLTGDWANIGHPVATVAEDGSFVVSKPEGTGGLVSVGTVAEQLLYEIGDPAAYILPDVICDFTQVKMEQVGRDQVKVSGVKGRAPTTTYKASATYQDGFRVGMYINIGGIDARAKANKVADAVLRRCAAMLADKGLPPYTETSVEVIGSESTYGGRSRMPASREVMLKVAAKHPSTEPLEMLLRELTSSGTSMAPGISSFGGNRPKVSPVVRLFSCLIPKIDVPVHVVIGDISLEVQVQEGTKTDTRPIDAALAALPNEQLDATVPLVRLAYGRSGDKGNHANIGIKAREPRYLPYILAALTPENVSREFEMYDVGAVTRYLLPGLDAMNFLLEDVLGGGGIASLRHDPQAKAYAQIVLDYPIPVPAALAREIQTQIG